MNGVKQSASLFLQKVKYKDKTILFLLPKLDPLLSFNLNLTIQTLNKILAKTRMCNFPELELLSSFNFIPALLSKEKS